MDTFLICLAIIIAAFAIALSVWWLFKPKRKSVVVIRPFKTRPNIIYKQGSGFGLDLGDRVVDETRRNDEQDLAWQHYSAVREQIYQNQQAAARRAAEQNRRDEAARELQQHFKEMSLQRQLNQVSTRSSCRNERISGDNSNHDYGSSSSSSYGSCSSSDSGSSSYSSSSSDSSSSSSCDSGSSSSDSSSSSSCDSGSSSSSSYSD